MKKKWIAVLSLEAAVCTAYVLLGQALPNFFGTAVAFPFQQIGLGLRTLSLSGSAGNVIAIVLYAVTCLIPEVFLVMKLHRKHLYREDSLLILLSLLLFPVLYLMINPHLQARYLGTAMALMGNTMLGSAVYTVLLCYGILKLLRRFYSAREHRLMDYLKYLLLAMAAFLVLGVFGTGLDDVLKSITSVQEQNQGSESTLGTTYVFLWLGFLVDALPNLLCCGLILEACTLLMNMQEDPYREEVITEANALSRHCGLLLTVTALCNMGFNLLQFLFAKQLRVVDSTLQLPLTTLVLVIGLLLFAQFIHSHKQLKEENEGFI